MARDQRGARRRVRLLSATAAAGLVLAAGTAHADAPRDVDVDECGAVWVCTGVDTPAEEGGEGQGGGGGEPAQSGGGGEEEEDPNTCSVVLADPQPPAGHPWWDGHDPETTTMYVEVCNWGSAPRPGAMGAVAERPILVVEGEDAPEAAPSPAQLAQQAVDRMLLEGPDIGIAPRPDGEGTVGVPVWMWTAEGPTTTGPNTSSASAGGITVTAVATAESITWDMGDGTEVTCTPPGTPYEASAGMAASPDCGHSYSAASDDQPGGKYTVTATTTWRVPWEGGGQQGVITTTRSSSTTLTIGELNVLN